LSAAQRERTKALFDRMKAEAVPLGERLIEEETALDRLFATKSVEPSTSTLRRALSEGRKARSGPRICVTSP
jgi:hypothetical protein